jgi:mitochondrial fission protein ELM1
MSRPLHIHVLSDGKPGHQNQSLGLADAIGRLTPVKVERISIAGSQGLFRRMGTALEGERTLTRPDLIIGAGHAVHPSLILLARKSDAPSVLLMKPSLPALLFDLCLIPIHDLKGDGPPPGNIVPTIGALNRVAFVPASGKDGKILLIGGPSSSHGWQDDEMLQMVKTIVTSPGWEATDSRRTPLATLSGLATACPALTVFPHTVTGPGWLPEKLGAAEEVWVTEDSVSMIYEALSSGARVGLLPVPVIRRNSRVVRGVRKLIEAGYVTRFEDWTPGTPLPAPPHILRESDRCAKIVLERFFSDLLPA